MNKPAKNTKPAAKSSGSGTIALNKRARHDYHLEERVEAGLVLEGWEVKSLRAGKAQLVDSYVLFKDGEAFLLGALITPLPSASTHLVTDATRTRKLLLNRRELNRLAGAVHRVAQRSGRRKHGVAQRLGFETSHRLSPQQLIFRVDLLGGRAVFSGNS